MSSLTMDLSCLCRIFFFFSHQQLNVRLSILILDNLMHSTFLNFVTTTAHVQISEKNHSFTQQKAQSGQLTAALPPGYAECIGGDGA